MVMMARFVLALLLLALCVGGAATGRFRRGAGSHAQNATNGKREPMEGSYTLVQYMHTTDCSGPYVCEPLMLGRCSPVGPRDTDLPSDQLYAMLKDHDGGNSAMEVVSCKNEDCDCEACHRHTYIVTRAATISTGGLNQVHDFQSGECNRFPKYGFSIRLQEGDTEGCVTTDSDIALGRHDVACPTKATGDEEEAEEEEEEKEEKLDPKYAAAMGRLR